MNKLIIIISFLFIAVACNNKKETEEKSTEKLGSTFDSTSLQTSELNEEGTGDQLFLMNYNFKPNETLKYRMTVFSQNEQHMEADTIMDSYFEQTMIYLINFKTISIDEDEIIELQCNVTSINLVARGMGKEITYQSGTKLDSLDQQQFAEHESFVNNPFNIRVDRYGELIEIYKTDKILNSYLTLRGLQDSVKTEDKAVLKQDLSERVIKPLIAQIIREVPRHKMAKDSTWSYQRESIPILTYNIDYKNLYKIGKLGMFKDQKVAIIDGTVESKVSGESTYTEGSVTYQFQKPISSASGKIYFNLDRGLIQKSRTETRMETSYTVEMPTPQGIQKGNTREIITNVNVLELL
jgi:hypothetical protein